MCPTEIHEASDLADDFRRVNAVVVGVSVDSVYSHRAWSRIPRAEGGVEGLDIILVSDLDRTLTRKFGILSKSNPSVSNRATFIINPEGVIMHVSVNESSIGRNFSEILRMLKGLQYSAQFGEVCPAKWKEGDKGIAPNAEAYSEWYNESQ